MIYPHFHCSDAGPGRRPLAARPGPVLRARPSLSLGASKAPSQRIGNRALRLELVKFALEISLPLKLYRNRRRRFKQARTERLLAGTTQSQ
eukprot:764569-Hanusia_phi.AAC.9